jgi:hypothetical protein
VPPVEAKNRAEERANLELSRHVIVPRGTDRLLERVWRDRHGSTRLRGDDEVGRLP